MTIDFANPSNGDVLVDKAADLFEFGLELSEQIRFEQAHTYWTVDSIAQQRRELNQIAMDLEDTETQMDVPEEDWPVWVDIATEGYTNSLCIGCVHDSGEGCNWTPNEDIPIGCPSRTRYRKEMDANIAGGYWYDEDNRPVEPKIVPVAKPCAKCIHPELQNCDACIPF